MTEMVLETPSIELSEEQQEAKAAILGWLEGPEPEFRLGGFAGTGKTTLIKDILASVHVATGVAAFTGKAVSVLRKKGVFRAITLHSMLYKAEFDIATKKIKWISKGILPYDFIIVDEASMVSNDLYDELCKHNAKLLFVGDPAQLEPVGDNPNLMRDCDYVLENIHRQAAGNPILKLAADIRKGKGKIKEGSWKGKDGNGSLTIVKSLRGIDIRQFDVVICAKNATRHAMNEKRRILDGNFGGPVVGERIINLRNDKNQGLFNGMILELKSITTQAKYGQHTGFIADLMDEAGDHFEYVAILDTYFGKDYKADGNRLSALPFDYAYCLTTHKSQGSEWEKVLVIDEPLWKTDRNRWRYTAFTRASKELTVVLTDD